MCAEARGFNVDLGGVQPLRANLSGLVVSVRKDLLNASVLNKKICMWLTLASAKTGNVRIA